MKKILITGTAGFIGFHLAEALLKRGDMVVGLDNINDYYDVNLKYGRLEASGIAREAVEGHGEGNTASAFGASETSAKPATSGSHPRLAQSSIHQNYRFVRMDLADTQGIKTLFETEQFDHVVHLAAQAGVRYSLTNPQAYIDANITGFLNILEACRAKPVKHLVYASSSSVYGKNTRMPFSVSDNVDHPVSLYAATKKSNELMAHTYSHLFGIPATGLRFFTVYGPWGRPDMALFLFTKAILEGRPIEVFNQGEMQRDFTYIDDIIKGVVHVLDKPAEAMAAVGDRSSAQQGEARHPVSESDPHLPDAANATGSPAQQGEPPVPKWDPANPDPSGSDVPHRVYNIGNSHPTKLMDFIEALEKALGRKAEKKLMPMQPGDVPATWADVSALQRDFGYSPGTPVEKGIAAFVEWYRGFYG
jgi:UDP-glucuronate 4-epimerase